MEQRIGPNIQPLQGAAVDPAFVPGITGPRPAEPKDAEPTEAVEAASPADEAASEETASEEETATEKRTPAKQTDLKKEAAEEEPSDDELSDEEPSDEEPSGEESSSDEPEEAEEPEETPEGGPVFEASDRRAKIVADHSGVRLRLDDQEAEFRWEEIGAVETESPRFGKRFTITVHTPDRRWYPIEIEASARSRFKEWETQLDEVLDTYFEDAEEADEAAAEVEEAEESAP
ncbi:hypothetical protein [Streptomyces sp. NPDC050982]|uniref:hypothetical protein n=1 Tax=Streptomyces sp. NPDC050982 TaxID=3154746 RepID=UPI0034006509